VLRHQNAILRRQVSRVHYEPADRLGLAALSHLHTPPPSPRARHHRTSDRDLDRPAIRNLVMDLADTGCRARYLIRDRDGKFPALTDEILAEADIQTMLTGVRMPRMNASMERWVQSCRRELLDRCLPWNERQLRRALRAYERFYNRHRAHQGLAPLRPVPDPNIDQERIASLTIRRQDRLGGILICRLNCWDGISAGTLDGPATPCAQSVSMSNHRATTRVHGWYGPTLGGAAVRSGAAGAAAGRMAGRTGTPCRAGGDVDRRAVGRRQARRRGPAHGRPGGGHGRAGAGTGVDEPA